MTSLTTTDPADTADQAIGGRVVPKPVLPTRPVLSPAALGGGGNRAIASILNSDHLVEVTSGRAAIALALLDMGTRDGDEILIPAYHCPAMVDPVVWAKGVPVFYRLNSDLSIDLDDVRTKITAKTRGIIAVHYFGFSHSLSALRSLCDERGIRLIEDCAHSAFGTVDGRIVGSWGDYAIACHTKFFATLEGGALVANRPLAAPVRLRAPGLGFTVNAALSAIQRALSYERLWILELPMTLAELAVRAVRLVRGRSEPASESPVMEAGTPGQFAASWVHVAMSPFSRFLYRRVSWQRLVERRRANYRTFMRLSAGIPGVRPLYRDLPEGVVPHVFPVIVERLDRVFALLEDAGVPMQRFGQFLWPEVSESTCAVTWDLSRRCVQFACHEDLSERDIEWIVDRLRDAVAGRPYAGAC